MLDSEAFDEEDDRNYRTEVTRSTIKAYKEALMYHQNELRTFCASRNVGFFTVCSDERIDEMFFRHGTEVGLVR